VSDLLTTAQAVALATQWRHTISGGRAATVSRTALQNWVARGHLAPAGLDERGRPLYALADLAHAEQATRDRALRQVSAPIS
jgi:hypothetical protein